MNIQAIVAQLVYMTLLFAVAIAFGRAPMTARSRFFLFACALLGSALPIAALAKFLVRTPIAIPPLFGSGTFGTTSAATASPFSLTNALALGSALVAIAIITISLTRTITFARRVRRSAIAPSAREENALAVVSPRRRPTLIRSAEACTAMVIGIVRPTIVLPDGGCDRLSDAELRSLLAHECAHAERRDNAFGVLERLLGAAYWFHPLMWMLRRELALAREEACDEMAADFDGSDNVISSITAMTRSFAAAPGASCATSSRLKERINHIMRYDSLRRSALSHRIVILLAFLIVGTLAVAVGASTNASSSPARSSAPEHSKYSGEKISLDLKDADLRDVLGTFAKLTKIEFVIDPDVHGKVTIAIRDTPWDEVLDRIVTENGYKWTLESGRMHIHS